VEAPQPESPKAVQPESPKAETPKAEAPKVEVAKLEAAKAEAARLEAARVAAQQRLNADRQAIAELLDRYMGAYRSRDPNAVREVFPNVPNFETVRRSFRSFRSIEMTLSQAQTQISGDAATVRCMRSMTFTDERGRHPTQGMITMSLHRDQGRWLINSIQ
jgi:ketosteroid isomerase-like protein